MSESIIEIICNNPYRVLGVFANASKERIEQNRAKLTSLLKEGKTFTVPLDLPGLLPPLSRTVESVERAYSQLANPKQRLYFAQFWLIRSTPEDDLAFKYLVDGRMKEAVEIWSRIYRRSDIASLQNRVFCALIMQENELALTHSRGLYSSNQSWEFSRAILGDPSPKDVETTLNLRDSLTNSLHTGDTVSTLFAESGKGAQTTEVRPSDPILVKIENAIAFARTLQKEDPEAALQNAQYLINSTKRHLQTLKHYNPENPTERSATLDKLGIEIINLAMSHHGRIGSSRSAEKSINTIIYAKEIIVGEQARKLYEESASKLQRALLGGIDEEELQRAKEAEYTQKRQETNQLKVEESALDSIVAKIENAIVFVRSLQEEDPEAALQNAGYLVNSTKRHLKKLKELGSEDQAAASATLDKLGTEIINLAIAHHNRIRSGRSAEEALNTMEYAQQVIVGAPAKKLYEESVLMLRGRPSVGTSQEVTKEDEIESDQNAQETSAQKSAPTRQEMRAQIEVILHTSIFDVDPSTPAETIYYACKPLLKEIELVAGGKDTEYLKLSTQVVDAILEKEIKTINSKVKSRNELIVSSSESDLARKKALFAHAWAVMDLIGTLDMTSDFTAQRYQPNRAEILKICQQLEIAGPVQIPNMPKAEAKAQRQDPSQA